MRIEMMRSVFLVLTTLFFSSISYACSCMGGLKPCQLAGSSTVFVGYVEDVRLIPGPGKFPEDGTYDATLQVKERFRGNLAARVHVYTAQQGSMCGFSFVKGATYLVYGGGSGKTVSTTICSGTKPVLQATEELAYLRQPDQGHGSIWGYAFRMQFDGKQSVPVKGLEVQARSAGRTLRTKVNDKGTFEFNDLQVGTYTLSATTPPGMSLSPTDSILSVDVESKVCSRGGFAFRNGASFNGHINVPSGFPAEHLWIDAKEVHYDSWEHNGLNYSIHVERSGDFHITGVEPGEYVIGIGAVQPPSLWPEIHYIPFARQLFPGTRDFEKAKIFKITGAEEVTDLVLDMPKTLFPADFRITLVDETGKPVQDGWVNRKHPDYSMTEGVTPPRSDAAGHVTLTTFAEEPWEISGYKLIDEKRLLCADKQIFTLPPDGMDLTLTLSADNCRRERNRRETAYYDKRSDTRYVTAKVVDQNGDPLPHSTVSVEGKDRKQHLQYWLETDAKGEVELPIRGSQFVHITVRRNGINDSCGGPLYVLSSNGDLTYLEFEKAGKDYETQWNALPVMPAKQMTLRIDLSSQWCRPKARN